MRQAMLLFAIFFLSVLMAAAQTSADTNGQGTTSNNSAPQSNTDSASQPATAPAPPSVSVTDPAQANSSQTAATTGNAAATGAPVDQRIVTPPSVSLGVSATSPVGAANATPGNQAGASNSTLAPNSSGMQMSNPNATTPVLPNINTSASASTPAANRAVVGYPGLPASAWSIGETDGSVADAARSYRTAKSMRHPHTYTNDDIARLNQNSVPQSPNANSNQPPVTNPSTMPASDVTSPQGAAAPANSANEQAPTAANPQMQKKSPFASKPAPPQN